MDQFNKNTKINIVPPIVSKPFALLSKNGLFSFLLMYSYIAYIVKTQNIVKYVKNLCFHNTLNTMLIVLRFDRLVFCAK